MKNTTLIILLAISLLLTGNLFAGENGPSPADTPAASTQKLPSLFIAEKEFNFGTVIEGTPVPHTYVVENHGSGILQILEVRPTCGCTTSNFSKEIAPGGQGNINVLFSSTGYKSPVEKHIIVVTNDPENKEFNLTITGTVEGFALITPQRVSLKGTLGEHIEATISIIKSDKYPFKIKEVLTSRLAEYVTFSLKEKENGYDLIISNSYKKPGRYFETITLKTDSPAKPEITIKVSGVIMDGK